MLVLCSSSSSKLNSALISVSSLPSLKLVKLMDPTHSAESNSTAGDTAQQTGNLSLERRYHPSYPYRVDNLAGDLVLLSKDNVHFHVHSIILKFASSFFREMLEIPRTSLESAEDPIPLEEDAEIIAAMLDVIYPYSILREEATKRAVDLFAEELIAAADKYDMLAISAAVKKALFTRTGNVPSLNDMVCNPQIRLGLQAPVGGGSKVSRKLDTSLEFNYARIAFRSTAS